MSFRPAFYSEPSESAAAYERWKQQQAAKQAAKQAPGYAIGKGLGGLAGAYGGKYLAGQVGSLFGSGGTAAAVPTVAELPVATSMLPSTAPVSTLTSGGGFGGGAAGGASAGGAPAGLSSVASYAVPAAIALAAAYNMHKITGGGKDSDHEAGRWRDAVAQGYKYNPGAFETSDDATGAQLADQSGIAALILGNAWHDNFTPEERASIMDKVRADPAAHFNERLGGYTYDKGVLAKYAQELATAKGQGDWAMGRYNEQKKRDDVHTQLLLGRGPNKLPGERNPNMRDFGRGPYRNYISADWMPEGSSDVESLASAVAGEGGIAGADKTIFSQPKENMALGREAGVDSPGNWRQLTTWDDMMSPGNFTKEQADAMNKNFRQNWGNQGARINLTPEAGESLRRLFRR